MDTRTNPGKLITLITLAPLSLFLALAGYSTSPTAATLQRRDLAAIKAEQAALTPALVLESLRRGNERFASGKPVILSCIDHLGTDRVRFLQNELSSH